MRSNHLAFTVEVFKIERNLQDGSYGLVIGGWVHADSTVVGMHVEIPGENLVWKITELSLESPGLVPYFDQKAASKRFHLTTALPDTNLPFYKAVLRVALDSGDRLMISIGSIFQATPEPWPSVARHVPLQVGRFDEICESGIDQPESVTERPRLLLRYAVTRWVLALIGGIRKRRRGPRDKVRSPVEPSQ